jgi:hypothetical protein
MSEWKERNRQEYVLVASCAYFASLFLTWWKISASGGESGMRVDGLGSVLGSSSGLSELCVVIAVAIFVLAVTLMRSRDDRLLLTLRHLAIALVIFNALSVLELWRSMTSSFGSSEFYLGGHLAYGAYVAIGASLLVLFSVLVLEAGGLRELFRRRRGGL